MSGNEDAKTKKKGPPPDSDEVLLIEKAKQASGAVAFRGKGELTYISGARLVNTVVREIINNQNSNVTIDLREVTYIDSFGVGCLLKIHNTMKEQRGVTANLVVIMTGMVLKRVQSTGLTKIIKVTQSAEGQ